MSGLSQDKYVLGVFARTIADFRSINKSIDEIGKLRTKAQKYGCSEYIRDALTQYYQFLGDLASINGSGIDTRALSGVHRICALSAPHIMENGLSYSFAPEGNTCYITKEDNATKVNPPLESAIVGSNQTKSENYNAILNALQHYSSMCGRCPFDEYHKSLENPVVEAKQNIRFKPD
jgi:hypothetical protein